MNTKKMLLLLSALALSDADAVSIQVLDDCNAGLNMKPLYTVLDSGADPLPGWSHIEKAKPTNEYQSLPLSDEAYQINAAAYRPDPSCNGEKVQNATLVVKLSDWTRQHSNGIEAILGRTAPRFNDVEFVLLDLRINSKGTEITSQEALKERYGDYLNDSKFDVFDNGKVNLGITLFEKGALDQSSRSFNSEFFLEIDQDLYADKWLRVMLPIDDFSFYTQKDYQNQSASLANYGDQAVYGFRINPENSHGNQLRNLLGEAWNTSIPETFKQMAISIRRVELLGKLDN